MNSLYNLYSSNLVQMLAVVEKFPTKQLNGPFLVNPTDYFAQPKKILVVGQETDGWISALPDVNAQLKEYEDFCVGKKYKSTPFWNITRKIENIFGIEPCTSAWANLNRFDQEGRTPDEDVLQEVQKLDSLLRAELDILQPDVCIFFTNIRNDGRISALYPGASFIAAGNLPTQQFARVTHEYLPNLTLRTPHPKFMRLKAMEESLMEYLRSYAGKDAFQETLSK